MFVTSITNRYTPRRKKTTYHCFWFRCCPITHISLFSILSLRRFVETSPSEVKSNNNLESAIKECRNYLRVNDTPRKVIFYVHGSPHIPSRRTSGIYWTISACWLEVVVALCFVSSYHERMWAVHWNRLIQLDRKENWFLLGWSNQLGWCWRSG